MGGGPASPASQACGGSLTTPSGQILPLTSTAVTARVSGPVASVEVQQVFVNDAAETIEAVYNFPLPHKASVHAVSFKIQDRVVKGEVKEKEEAERRYAEARAEGRTATLVEQETPNLFTMSVANVRPDDTITVTLEYQEWLRFDDGEFCFLFPLVAADRYNTEPSQAGAKSRLGQQEVAGLGAGTGKEEPASEPGRGPRVGNCDGSVPAVIIDVSIKAEYEIEAPRCVSHAAEITHPQDGEEYKVRLVEGTVPDRDFLVRWRMASGVEVRPLAVFDRVADRPGTFVLTVAPPGDVAASRSRPHNVVVLVDRSASMLDAGVEQAKHAVTQLVGVMGSDDKVAVLAFDHEVVSVVGGEGKGGLLSHDRVAQLLPEALDGVKPRGGSELVKALEAGVALLGSEQDRAQIVVLVTDAAVGNDGLILRSVPPALGKAARLFVLGLGPAPNRHLIERMADVGGGASDVVGFAEDVKDSSAVLERFCRRVLQGGPVLTGLKLNWDGALVSDVFPRTIPDLFGGQPVHVVGRYSGSGVTKLCLTGRDALGQEWKIDEEVTVPAATERREGLERVWARLRIDDRLERLRESPKDAADARLEVISLALQHGIVTPYTSFVVVDTERASKDEKQREKVQGEERKEGGAKRVEVPLAAPGGGRGESEEYLAAPDTMFGVLDRLCGEGRELPGGKSVEALVDKGSSLALGSPMIKNKMALSRRAAARATLFGSAVGASPSLPGAAPPIAPSPHAGLFGRLFGRRSSARPADACAPESSYAAPPSSAVAYGAPMGPPHPVLGEGPAALLEARMPYAIMPGAATAMSESGATTLFGAASGAGPAPRSEASTDEAECDERLSAGGSSSPFSCFTSRSGGPPPPPCPARDCCIAGGARSGLGSLHMAEVEADDVAPYGGGELVAGDADGGVKGEDTVLVSGGVVKAECDDVDEGKGQAVKAEGAAGVPSGVIAPGAGQGELDLVFLVDETGSMGTYIQQVQQHILSIIWKIQGCPLCGSLRIGLVRYRDHPPQDSSFVTKVHDLTATLAPIQAAVAAMQANGGGDGPEAVTDGLYDLLRLDWRPNSARIVVWVGDAPPHGVGNHGDGFPDGCPCRHHWYTQAESAREMGIVIHAVACIPALQSYAHAEDVYRMVAKVTRGRYVPLDQAQTLVSLILGVAETELDRQRVEEVVSHLVSLNAAELRPMQPQQQSSRLMELVSEQKLKTRSIRFDERNVSNTLSMEARDVSEEDVQQFMANLRRKNKSDI